MFTQEHWADMFRMLKMPRNTALDRLTFGHIVAASDHILANAEALKV